MTVRERLIQAAALVIRQDAKLLGIPSVRDELIQDAVRVASGTMNMPTRVALRKRAPGGSTENANAMHDALSRAVEAVRVERIAVLKRAA
jgi:hypothetical protein